MIGCKLDREAIRFQRRQCYLDLAEAQPLLPSVVEWLDEARRPGLKLGVASSSTREWVEGHLSKRNLHPYFQCVRCADDVKRTKPDPELYLSCLQGLEVLPELALALEDSPNGIAAARGAGSRCIAVPNPLTASLDLSWADLLLNALSEQKLNSVLEGVASLRHER